ncbi:hypothetical protein IMCC3317_40390 [Kordia antarctica]|uniref:MPN domain-containing protein n=1 Tax=Kordia antarctica TaxID=1218801 RepID=A0A7L4ZPU3_9FLAO|nr:JAB domain-containing protein [Kordia antarctica]QHI38645.1 hypothetical protein IMCC3317_40390 [Kordia antarctica]
MNVRLTAGQKKTILNGYDVYSVMKQILLRQNKIRRAQEYFWVVGLKANNTILFIELVAIGAQNTVNVSPPDIFRMGIYKLAVRMILVHNHPSGNLNISQPDKDITDRLIKVGKLVKIEVLDHLIITETGFTSFKDKGIMDELRKSGFYELVEKESEQMKAFKLQIEKDKVRNEERYTIAKRMKDEGYDIDTIKKLTGLNKREIGKA